MDGSNNRFLEQVYAALVQGTIIPGRKVVTTAGTPVQVAALGTKCRKVTITAETDNTGYIVVGDSTVIAALATRLGSPLAAGQSITLNLDDLGKVWIDSTVSTDGVTYVYTV